MVGDETSWWEDGEDDTKENGSHGHSDSKEILKIKGICFYCHIYNVIFKHLSYTLYMWWQYLCLLNKK